MSEPQLEPPSVGRAQLREIGLFGGLPDEALDRLATELSLVHVDPGTLVMREGEMAREMFVVLGGELEVLRRSRGGAEGGSRSSRMTTPE